MLKTPEIKGRAHDARELHRDGRGGRGRDVAVSPERMPPALACGLVVSKAKVREWLDEVVRDLQKQEETARKDAAFSADSYDSGFARGIEEARITVQRIIAWHDGVPAD